MAHLIFALHFACLIACAYGINVAQELNVTEVVGIIEQNDMTASTMSSSTLNPTTTSMPSSTQDTYNQRRGDQLHKRRDINRANREETSYSRCSTETKLLTNPKDLSVNVTLQLHPHPDSCEDYNTAMEFVEGDHVQDDSMLFVAGNDIDRKKFYICKAKLNGKMYLGRGHFQRNYYDESRYRSNGVGNMICWIILETAEIPLTTNISFLRKPKNVKLVWRNAPSKDNLAVMDENNNPAYIGRSNFQVPIKSLEPACYMDPNQQEIIIPGYAYLEDGDNKVLKFTFGSKVYQSPEYQLLTCAEVKDK